MERAFFRIPKSLKCSFSFVSLLVLFGITAVTAVARAQETMEAPATDAELQEAETVVPSEATSSEPLPPTTLVPITTTGLTDAQQVRVRNLAANISNRLDAVHARLSQIAGRVETRIATSEAADLDTTTAGAELAAARAALANAGTELAAIDVAVASVVGSPDTAEAWARTRVTYEVIDADLRAAAEALARALTALGSAPLRTPVLPEGDVNPQSDT